MRKTLKLTGFLAIVSFILLLNGCDLLEEVATTVSGKVDSGSTSTVVIALNGSGDAYTNLEDIQELNETALNSLGNVVKGFDLGISQDSSYTAILTSGGDVYMVAVADDGLVSEELDSLDHIGWYGDTDTFNLVDTVIVDTIAPPDTLIIDTSFVYTTPSTVSVSDGGEKKDVNIENLLEYKWLLKIQEEL